MYFIQVNILIIMMGCYIKVEMASRSNKMEMSSQIPMSSKAFKSLQLVHQFLTMNSEHQFSSASSC